MRRRFEAVGLAAPRDSGDLYSELERESDTQYDQLPAITDAFPIADCAGCPTEDRWPKGERRTGADL